MNYQTLLSSILESKYYTLCNSFFIVEDISDLCLTLQRNSGLKILPFKLPQIQSKQGQSQILLSCPQRLSQDCPFSYIFRKINSMKKVQEYELIKCNQKHSNKCLLSRNANKQDKNSSKQQNQLKPVHVNRSINLTCQTVRSIQTSQTVAGSPLSKQSMNLIKFKQGSKNQLQKKLYSEDQFSLLKKELELDCKGLLSKSTQFQNQNQNNLIKKINFHCKYQSACPYEAILILEQQNQLTQQLSLSSKRFYSLQIINSKHLSQCILEQEIINYNENTMKIDKQLNKLSHIIECSSYQIKPKQILKKLAHQLGQKEDFIYQGLEKKINKRAIKKYFDNCVAKIRMKLSPQQKVSNIEGNGFYGSILKEAKKDADYVCRSISKG